MIKANPNFKIMSQERCEEYTKFFHAEDGNTLIISITAYKEPYADITIQDNTKAILRLQFDDAEERDRGGLHLMTKEQAAEVADFINAAKRTSEYVIDTIIVHCYADVSRSAAVAAAIKLYLTLDDNDIWTDWKYCPNSYVYRMVLSAFDHETDDDWIVLDKESQYAVCPFCNKADHVDPLQKFCRYCGKRIKPLYYMST